MDFESIGHWLKDNHREDILKRWDYDLNHVSPFDVSKTDKKKYWFKCPRGIHESEEFHINKFHTGRAKNNQCKKCLSFAQGIIDMYDEETLWRMWDKNNNGSPWDYGFQSKKKLLFHCLNNEKHIYYQSCDAKSQGQSCPYCSNRKITKENSLGNLYPFTLDIWSDTNTKTPYDYSPHSGEKVWWICKDGIHPNYNRSISSSFECDFLCPKCALLKGYEDLTGNVFGEWTVIAVDNEASNIHKTAYSLCKCSCGVIKSINNSSLKNGSSKCCGGYVHCSGENNPNWKGGISSENARARSNVDYLKWRNAVYKKDNYCCQCCGSKKGINAHHILNFADNPDYRLDESNGITLCEDCHSIFIKGSFHNIYGTHNNTPQQLEEYINNKRIKLGIQLPFSLIDYRNGVNIL